MLEELCKRIQQLIQDCCATLRRSRNKKKNVGSRLAEKFDRFPTLRNNTQQYPTTCNRMCKRTQHVTFNNVGSCWSTISRPLARSLKPRPNGRNFVGNNSQHCWRNNVGNCWVRLHAALGAQLCFSPIAHLP